MGFFTSQCASRVALIFLIAPRATLRLMCRVLHATPPANPITAPRTLKPAALCADLRFVTTYPATRPRQAAVVLGASAVRKHEGAASLICSPTDRHPSRADRTMSHPYSMLLFNHD